MVNYDKACIYTAQGFLECKSSPYQQNASPQDSVETFIEAKTQGTDVNNNITYIHFTERPTSKRVWDQESANSICQTLCEKHGETWTGGFRSIGGSVCYCNDEKKTFQT